MYFSRSLTRISMFMTSLMGEKKRKRKKTEMKDESFDRLRLRTNFSLRFDFPFFLFIFNFFINICFQLFSIIQSLYLFYPVFFLFSFFANIYSIVRTDAQTLSTGEHLVYNKWVYICSFAHFEHSCCINSRGDAKFVHGTHRRAVGTNIFDIVIV